MAETVLSGVRELPMHPVVGSPCKEAKPKSAVMKEESSTLDFFLVEMDAMESLIRGLAQRAKSARYLAANHITPSQGGEFPGIATSEADELASLGFCEELSELSHSGSSSANLSAIQTASNRTINPAADANAIADAICQVWTENQIQKATDDAEHARKVAAAAREEADNAKQQLEEERAARTKAEEVVSELKAEMKGFQEELELLRADTQASRIANENDCLMLDERRHSAEKEAELVRGQLNCILPEYLNLKKTLADIEQERSREEEKKRGEVAEEVQMERNLRAAADARNALLEKEIANVKERLEAERDHVQAELRAWKMLTARDAYRALSEEARAACRHRLAAAADKTHSEESFSDSDDTYSDRSMHSDSSLFDGQWTAHSSGMPPTPRLKDVSRSSSGASLGSHETCRCGASEVEALAMQVLVSNDAVDIIRAEMVALRGMLEMYQQDAEALQREVEIHHAQMELYEEGCQLEIPPNSCTQQACKGYCERLGRGRGCKYNHECQIPNCRTRKLHGHAAHKRWLEKHNPNEAAALAAFIPSTPPKDSTVPPPQPARAPAKSPVAPPAFINNRGSSAAGLGLASTLTLCGNSGGPPLAAPANPRISPKCVSPPSYIYSPTMHPRNIPSHNIHTAFSNAPPPVSGAFRCPGDLLGGLSKNGDNRQINGAPGFGSHAVGRM